MYTIRKNLPKEMKMVKAKVNLEEILWKIPYRNQRHYKWQYFTILLFFLNLGPNEITHKNRFDWFGVWHISSIKNFTLS